jgi:hypothetical protein
MTPEFDAELFHRSLLLQRRLFLVFLVFLIRLACMGCRFMVQQFAAAGDIWFSFVSVGSWKCICK